MKGSQNFLVASTIPGPSSANPINREERTIVNRVIRDDPSKGDMHNRQPITPKLLWTSMKDYDMWPLYAIGLTGLIPATPPSLYFTLNLRSFGFSVLVTNLLTIPHTILSMVTLLGITYLSEKWDERSFTALSAQLWRLPFLIVLYIVDINSINRWVAFAVLTLLLGTPTGTFDHFTSRVPRVSCILTSSN